MPRLPPLPYRLPVSPIELFLLRMLDEDANVILRYFEPALLVSLSKLNTRLRDWFDWYSTDTWNIEDFVSIYVKNNLTLLSLVDGKDVMMYGEFYLLHRYLLDEGYDTAKKTSSNPAVRRSWMQVSMHERVGNLLHDAGAVHDSWSLTADQSWSPEDHIGYKFKFARTLPGRPTQRINLHLIRSIYTCYATKERAVAPFARSTFRDGMAFSLRNMRLLSSDVYKFEHCVRSPGHCWIFKVASGPPIAYNLYTSAEVGVRFMGDRHCWVIPRERKDPLLSSSAYKGPSFEVLDWKLFHDDEGTYLTIGEPSVWRNVDVLVLRHDATSGDIWSLPNFSRSHGDVVLDEIDFPAEWYPNGYCSVLLSSDIATATPLPYSYRLYFDSNSVARPFNKCVYDMFRQPWIGTVVLAKYHRNNTPDRIGFIHIPRYDAEHMLVHMGKWMAAIWARAYGNLDIWH
ncbi:hypothetical protein DFP72DRAFT_1070361 [Ephemerocybe angulata]|uniref:Uncharacterized protein n=1 Tax=Ephemerocybe angulata TaxID=980116 RepID=A0A8H6HSK9_9AGAR|nr:hypothetical protein DFP72DRAFT_1070361 [Tulosesus angulatus]